MRGEHEFQVPPLDLSAAAALFETRSETAEHDPALIAEICSQLDGLPLAVELAAARTKHLALPALASQLNNRLGLLTGGPIDLPLRQQAIRETVAWSHDLLKKSERILFRRLAAYSGGWTLASLEAVCDTPEPLSVISGLIEQSLVSLTGQGVEARYGMLDVIQEYAAERLLEAKEIDSTAQRHALYHLELAEEGEAKLVGARQEEWYRRLDAERGNLRRAIAWALRCASQLPSGAIGATPANSPKDAAGPRRRSQCPAQLPRRCGQRHCGALHFWSIRRAITAGWPSSRRSVSTWPGRAETRWTFAMR